ncbi:MAG: LysR family transcriptional regulator [Myxococcota bacterium]
MNVVDPDFGDLVVFVRVIEAGSITGAARSLSLSKSAVSRRLARLEGRLGTRLVERSTRALAPTPEGLRLHDRVLPALQALTEAQQEVAHPPDELSGAVRVAAPPDVGADVLPHAVAAFARRHPEVRIDISLTRAEGSLLATGHDLAIRGGRQPDSAMAIRLLHASPFELAASPEYLATHGKPKTIAELARHRCLVFVQGGRDFSWQDGDPALPPSSAVALRADDLRVLRELCAQGMGLALLPTDATREARDAGSLVHVLPAVRREGSSLYVLQQRPAYLAPQVTAFRDHLVAYFAETGEWS